MSEKNFRVGFIFHGGVVSCHLGPKERMEWNIEYTLDWTFVDPRSSKEVNFKK